MRTSNSPLISVVIPASPEAVLTVEWATADLAFIPHEVIVAPTWVTGSNLATGEYICFLEKDCVLSENYFDSLLEIFENKGAFRKLAMVAPILAANNYERRIYGYRVADGGMEPSLKASSTAPYLVQVAYLPGALIRRSALGFLVPSRNIMEDSATACIYFWGRGLRIVLNPEALYVSTSSNLVQNYNFTNPVSKVKAAHMTELFNRERIG